MYRGVDFSLKDGKIPHKGSGGANPKNGSKNHDRDYQLVLLFPIFIYLSVEFNLS